MKHLKYAIAILSLTIVLPNIVRSDGVQHQRFGDKEWCKEEKILKCANEKYSDISAFDIGEGYPYPQGYGLYTAVRLVQQFDTIGNRIPWILPTNTLLMDNGDSLIGYSVIHGIPTAKQLLKSLKLLATEVIQQEPGDYPIGYLFMQKAIESTLYISAREENKEIYSATERFRNCIQISIMTNALEDLKTLCAPQIHKF